MGDTERTELEDRRDYPAELKPTAQIYPLDRAEFPSRYKNAHELFADSTHYIPIVALSN